MSVLAADLTARSFVDSGALHLGTQMYYQVYDANSVPEAHRLSPDGGLPGQEITVRGAGFDPDCSRNSVYIAGSTAHVVDCSFIHLVFEIPEESITGIVMVGTPRGIVLVGDPCTDLSRKTATWNADEPKRSEGVFDLLFELRLPENHETPKVLRGWKKMARIDIHVDLDRGLVSPTNHPKEWGLRVVRDPAQPRPELWVSQYRLLSSMSFTLEEAGRPTGTLKVDESAVPALLAQGNAIRATVICSALPVIGSTSSSR